MNDMYIIFAGVRTQQYIYISYMENLTYLNLISSSTQEFYSMMVKFGSALVVGAPVAVFYR